MDPIEIDDAAEYSVALAAPVTRGVFTLRPRDLHRMRGVVLREVVETHGWEVVADAAPVA